MNSPDTMKDIANLIRYYIIVSTTAAGSGHATSSLSATDLMAVLFAKFYSIDLQNPDNTQNDRLIFSKGHASPLFYALYAVSGVLSKDELLTLRQIDSPLEGHPTLEFKFTQAATGSLGQGLSIGAGMAKNAKLENLDYKTYVLLGDSELAEGSNFEAVEWASFNKLDNLIAILDVNRLGQRGETMHGWNTEIYEKRFQSFGWETIVIDGHNFDEIEEGYNFALANKTGKPIVIIAKTVKGKGVSLLEDKEGWHGKAMDSEQAKEAIQELGEINKSLKINIQHPITNIHSNTNSQVSNSNNQIVKANIELSTINYQLSTNISTRKAYGEVLSSIGEKYSNIIALDAEVSNSTFAKIFKQKFPQRFLEMYIAEQNMVGVAIGLSKMGKKPFVSTFAAFLTRAHDQIRMAQYSKSNIVFVGSHAGVSIGQDGPSQMGLEDIAMFRAILGSVVIYPADGNCTAKMIEELAKSNGISYLRTTRADTPVIYSKDEQFKIGGSKVVKQSDSDKLTVIGAGITLHEALKAYDELKKEGIDTRVIDLYSIKPIDSQTLIEAAKQTGKILVVEDHFAEGGIAEAVRSALKGGSSNIESLAILKTPHSGKPEEVLSFEGIDCQNIVNTAKIIINNG